MGGGKQKSKSGDRTTLLGQRPRRHRDTKRTVGFEITKRIAQDKNKAGEKMKFNGAHTAQEETPESATGAWNFPKGPQKKYTTNTIRSADENNVAHCI